MKVEAKDIRVGDRITDSSGIELEVIEPCAPFDWSVKPSPVWCRTVCVMVDSPSRQTMTYESGYDHVFEVHTRKTKVATERANIQEQ